jgi:hypothetical protein
VDDYTPVTLIELPTSPEGMCQLVNAIVDAVLGDRAPYGPRPRPPGIGREGIGCASGR